MIESRHTFSAVETTKNFVLTPILFPTYPAKFALSPSVQDVYLTEKELHRANPHKPSNEQTCQENLCASLIWRSFSCFHKGAKQEKTVSRRKNTDLGSKSLTGQSV